MVGAVSGSGIAVGLSVLAGVAGAVQVALMSQLGDRISIIGAVAFATLFTAVASFLILIIARRSVSAYVDGVQSHGAPGAVPLVDLETIDVVAPGEHFVYQPFHWPSGFLPPPAA